MLLTNNKKYYDYARSYTDHGHELDLTVSRGNDKAIMPGFNYRMTEIHLAIGKVQLNKLKNIIVEHKKRYEILDNISQDKQFVRQELNNCNGSYDTFILKDLNQKQRESILKILAKNNFGIKEFSRCNAMALQFFLGSILLAKMDVINLERHLICFLTQ